MLIFGSGGTDTLPQARVSCRELKGTFEVVSSNTTFLSSFIKIRPEILELKRSGGRPDGRADWLAD